MNAAVILMAYGSPATAEDVPAYLADIREGRPVSQEAVDELAERYRRIGGRSPLDEITEAQRAALERELGVPVFVGMKHWRPRIAEAVEAALAGGADTLVGLVLAPHYSRLSIAGYRERLEEALARAGPSSSSSRAGTTTGRFSTCWPSACAASTAASSSRPTRCRSGSCKTAIPTATNCWRPRAWSPSAPDSRTGRSRSRARARPASPGSGRTSWRSWTRLAANGVRRVLVCPVGFVSDHLEILWDLDIEAREKAAELGLELERIES
mgnify:CR=1 FL=1